MRGRLMPPRQRNDCFAMPPGVDWVPLDEAIARLAERMVCVTGAQTVSLALAGGRILAEDVTARRANPPYANSAVDGYVFAGPAGEGVVELPLAEGRAAAGMPFSGSVPAGSAIRILTGAILPEGGDTVVLEEDTAGDGGRIAFNGPLKKGANTRRAGEDFAEGETLLAAGRRLRPPDLALLAAGGISEVAVRRRLRVGVLSTGDEVADVADMPQGGFPPGVICDSNRPMLLDLVARWGFEPVDLGRMGDDRGRLRGALDEAADRCDALLTSGGASAGDEDHLSAILRAEGRMDTWRIALKPGRPLALGMWRDLPVFGLPGNPVAALVCSLVFGWPALSAMAGGQFVERRGFSVPAAFSKDKKAGRREFLRARINSEGAVEVFKSEGSGRISGLSWADGLVEIGDDACQITPGDPVSYLPWSSFGL